MGAEIALAAANAGCPTTLLRGPGTVKPRPSELLTEARFESAAELEALLSAQWPSHDLLFMAAAVADFRPKPSLGIDGPAKIRRQSQGLRLDLEPVPDLVAGLARESRTDQRLIGFALEPEDDLDQSAARKLREKAITAIVANPLETLEAEEIRGYLLLEDGTRRSPTAGPMPKADFARWLVGEVLALG